MRILINGWFLDQLSTGSGQYLAGLVEWLPRVSAGHEFILVKHGQRAQKQESKKTTETEPTAQNATCNTQYVVSSIHVHTPFDRLSQNFAKLWFEQIAFPLACRRLRADVAFVPYWGAPGWSTCPVVVTVHDLIPLLLPHYRGGPLQRGYTALASATARRATAILTDSEASKRDIIAHLGIAETRVHAVHLAADTRFRPVTDSAELARVHVKYRLPDEPFLLYMGGFDARKNVVRTVQAYARLAPGERDRFKLVIAGKLPAADTDFTPDPRLVARTLNIEERVHFAGWVDETDKPTLYSLALGTVFVSDYEGFGLPVIEAMACDSFSQSRGTM